MQITDPVLMFAFIMFVILVIPFLFTRLRLPGIVGLIISGIVIGPHALGVIESGGSFQLFSSIGLIYIMFLAGLEINLNEFNRQKKFSIVLGGLTFLIPMIIGTFGSKYMFSFSWSTAILLASMFASHTLIPFPITSRLGINKERSVVSAVGGTIITDTAALLVLAIIAEKATADLTPVFWIRQIIFLIALVVFALWILPRIAYEFFKILTPDGGSEFILILALVFLTAYFAHLAGVEAIIGAFFAGLSLSRLISEQSPLKNRLEFVGNTLFIPFFLISVGMLVDIRVMVSEWDVWTISLFMVSAVIFSKYIASFLFTKMLKFNKDERNLIFGLTVNQAAATLAAVIVGLRLGIFSESVLNGTIFMILATCLVGPWFTEKYGQNIARAHLKSSDHAHDGAEERIMLAINRAESVDLLTDVALSLRTKDSKQAIFPLHVIQDGMDIDKRLSFGEKILSGVVARVVAANVPVSPVSRIDVNVAGGILRAIKECHADTLVLGSVSPRESNLRTMLFDVSDKVSDESEQLFFLCQLVHPLNIGKNVFVLISPMLEWQKGFNHALESVKHLAVANKLNITIMGIADTIKHVEKSSFKKKAAVDVSFWPLDQWKDISACIRKAGLKEADSIIFMTARKGRISWRPSFKRLFATLGAEFPENNILMVYPADAHLYTADSKNPYKEGIKDSHPLLARPAVTIKEQYMEDALIRLLQTQFSSASDILREVMKKLIPLDPVELSHGIVLFHTHSEYLTEPVILLGIGDKCIEYQSLQQEIHAFFVLISPKDETNVHLQALTKVARMARELEQQKSKES